MTATAIGIYAVFAAPCSQRVIQTHHGDTPEEREWRFRRQPSLQA